MRVSIDDRLPAIPAADLRPGDLELADIVLAYDPVSGVHAIPYGRPAWRRALLAGAYGELVPLTIKRVLVLDDEDRDRLYDVILADLGSFEERVAPGWRVEGWR